MNKIDQLEKAIKSSYGFESVLLDCSEDRAIIKHIQNNYIEYVVVTHNYKSVFNGRYYMPISQTVEQARKNAWEYYKKNNLKNFKKCLTMIFE